MYTQIVYVYIAYNQLHSVYYTILYKYISCHADVDIETAIPLTHGQVCCYWKFRWMYWDDPSPLPPFGYRSKSSILNPQKTTANHHHPSTYSTDPNKSLKIRFF